MDSSLTIDSALIDPAALLSQRIQSPTDAQKNQPVCVLVHGFSASSYEFNAYKVHANSINSSLLYSTIVLGGHGRNYQAFKDARYEDWLLPIVTELEALTALGYRNISIFAVSAGATGTLHLALTQQLPPVKQLILMDPYIIPVNPIIYLLPVLKLFISNSVSGAISDTELKNWYINRPSKALNELRRLMRQVQSDLKQNQSAIDTTVHVFTSAKDSISNTIGADLIQTKFDAVTIHRYDSAHHVIIEPTAKATWNDLDQQLFEHTVKEVVELINN